MASIAQIIMESKASCAGARRHLAAIKAAASEVLTAIKTKQLAQELLLYKEDHLQDIAKTGARGPTRKHLQPYALWACGKGHSHCVGVFDCSAGSLLSTFLHSGG